MINKNCLSVLCVHRYHRVKVQYSAKKRGRSDPDQFVCKSLWIFVQTFENIPQSQYYDHERADRQVQLDLWTMTPKI